MKQSVKKMIAFVLTLAMMCGILDMPMLAKAYGAGTAVEDKTVSVGEIDYSYKVTLPAGYNKDDADRKYPVLYLMPDNGISGVSQSMQDGMAAVLEGTNAVDMIIVEPVLIPKSENAGADVYQAVSGIIAAVDAEYHTVADSSARAVMGTQVGGYLAEILTWTDGNGTVVDNPVLFGMSASIHGDFQSGNNIWKETYGDFYDLMTDNGTGDGKLSNQLARKFYTFMDAASEDPGASADKGANDIISYFIQRGGAYGGFYYPYYGNADSDVLELTVKNSAYDDAFIKKSVDEAVNGIANKMIQGMVTGSLKLTPQAAYASEESIKAVYNLTVSNLYTAYCGADAENELKLTISMADADTGEKVAEDQVVTIPVKEGTYTNADNPIVLPNSINRISTTVSMSCELLGKKIDVDTQPLVRIAATGKNPEDQLIDLMGSWKFHAEKTVTAGALPSEAEYGAWEEVYPCLGWWDSSFATSENMANYPGYAWYVKEFDIPADFPEGEYVVPVGFFDETDVCYINGHLIGSTGIDPETWQASGNPWDTERIYSVSSEHLNIGGKNVMTVLMHNDSGGGGWYDGHPGLYSTAAYNKMTSKPSVYASEEEAKAVRAAVAEQIKAIQNKDLKAYAATVDPEYFQSGIDKEAKLAEVSGYIDGAGEVSVTDTDSYVFVSDGLYYYQAKRTIKKANGEETQGDITEYYQISNGKAVLYGEHDRFFTQYMDSKYKASALKSENETERESFLVYLPEGYFDKENADRRYPSAYVFHQINSSSNSYAIDAIDKLMDQGIADGRIKDTILIIPDSAPTSWWKGDWVKMVTEEVLPFADAHYRTITDARYRFTAGASMGGSGSYNIGLKNPELFSGIVSFFGAINMGDKPLDIALAQSDAYLNYYSHYFVCGNRDMYKFGIPAITLDKKLRQAGVAHFMEIEEGEHDSPFYLPYVIEAFGYQTSRMPEISAQDAKNIVSAGSVSASESEGNKLQITYSVKINKAVKSYKNQIPASDYTANTSPAFLVPVTVKIEQGGKTVYSKTVTEETTGAKTITLEDTFEAECADLDLNSKYTVSAAAGILNQTVLLGSETVNKAASNAAAEVDKLIAAIGTVGKDSGKAIKAAQDAYNALSAEAKALVTKANVLTTAQKEYTSVVKAEESKTKAAAAEKAIAAIGKVTTKSKAKIDAARKKYNALDKASQAYVKNYSVLKKAEADYAKLVKKAFKAKKPSAKVAKSGKKALKVSWKKISGAKGYKVYRSTKKSKGYKLVKTIKKGSKVSFKDTKVKKGKKYYYKVRAYRTVSGKTVYSKYSKVVSKKR